MAEVLIRLSEEEAALLPPGDFLPVLEHYGVMYEFDRWVVQQVLRKLAGLGNLLLHRDLSHQTLADQTFPEFLANEIAAAGIPADSLLFEIDEADALALPRRQ